MGHIIPSNNPTIPYPRSLPGNNGMSNGLMLYSLVEVSLQCPDSCGLRFGDWGSYQPNGKLSLYCEISCMHGKPECSVSLEASCRMSEKLQFFVVPLIYLVDPEVDGIRSPYTPIFYLPKGD